MIRLDGQQLYTLEEGGQSSFRIENDRCQFCGNEGLSLTTYYAGEVCGDDESVGICRNCLAAIVVLMRHQK